MGKKEFKNNLKLLQKEYLNKKSMIKINNKIKKKERKIIHSNECFVKIKLYKQIKH